MARLYKIHLGGSITPTGSVTMSISHNLWATWASLAIRHERWALDVRRGHGTAERPDLSGELRESLLAMTASAFALDGFYGAIRDLVYSGGRVGKPESRAGTIFEAVKRASDVAGKTMNENWLPELKWLFDARRQGVHHLPQFSEGLPHPSVEGLAADEYALYRVENATRAVDLVLSVLEGCIGHPKPALREWAGRNTAMLTNLLAERQAQDGT